MVVFLWMIIFAGSLALAVWAHFGDFFILSSWDFAALAPDILGIVHRFSSHSMHAVLSTLLLAAIVWEIWLSMNHAIYEAFAILGSSLASGTMPFAHSMGVVFKSALNVTAASMEMRRWLATNSFLVLLLWLFGLILVISLACKKMPLQVSYLLLLAASSTYGLWITLSLISAFAVLEEHWCRWRIVGAAKCDWKSYCHHYTLSSSLETEAMALLDGLRVCSQHGYLNL
ncbi:hypothetical protein Taro_047319 [Colocasia esculenta]|uniref:Uncharacterized protein n=1 Tax=Colocasia esculenta TaxID=4460 RepID=A0A843X3P5_COLES|nr:hypothetical protein [Colocasia esculenta]